MERASPVEPETNPAISPEPEEKVTISLSDLRTLIRENVKEAVAPLIERNAQLQEEVAKAGHLEYATGIPLELQRTDVNVDPRRMSVARSVTIATRCVVENPDQYRNVVDPGGLSVNNASPLSPKNFAECFERDPDGIS